MSVKMESNGKAWAKPFLLSSWRVVLANAWVDGNPRNASRAHRLLNHAIAKAKCYSHILAVACGSETFSLPQEIRLLPDQSSYQGPIAGLDAAIQFGTELGARYVMIMPCDTPFLPDDLLPLLHQDIGTSRSAMARYAERFHPACSLWRADIASLLNEYLVAGRRSLIGFAEVVGHVAVTIPPANIDPFFNINTKNDIAESERIFASIRAHQ